MADLASVVEAVSPSASVDDLTGVYPSGHLRQRLVSSRSVFTSIIQTRGDHAITRRRSQSRFACRKPKNP